MNIDNIDFYFISKKTLKFCSTFKKMIFNFLQTSKVQKLLSENGPNQRENWSEEGVF